MADRDGALIHEPPNPTQPHRPDVDKDPPPPPCVGCGGFHGGVGAERLCLINSLRASRAAHASTTRIKDAEIARLLGCLKEFEPK
jgi:hypothetical protein